MKQKVIEFFQNLPKEEYEQFNQAFELYRQSDNKNIGIERVLNATGHSKTSLDNLLYDLQKLHGITDVEKAERSLQKAEGSLQNELDDIISEKEDLEYENEDLKSENEQLKTLSAITTKSVREEFPFLSEKDCPDELKILIADKITAWNCYLKTQELLVKVNSGELVLNNKDLAILAKTAVNSFAENQKIYEELNCYAITGKILGVHPIFKKLQLSREVEEMTADELIKYKSASARYFSGNKTALSKASKAKDSVKAEEIKNRVAERSEKLFLVNKKLGIKNK